MQKGVGLPADVYGLPEAQKSAFYGLSLVCSHDVIDSLVVSPL